MIKNTLICSLATLLSSCVVYPEKVHYFDKDCGVESKKYVLKNDLDKMPTLNQCSGQACIAQTLGLMGILSVELVVSGTIVLAGNTVYWVEKQQNCKEKTE